MTAKQRAVVDCLLEGMSDKEIARKLKLPITTVKHRISRAAQSMGISKRYVRRVRIVYLLSLNQPV